MELNGVISAEKEYQKNDGTLLSEDVETLMDWMQKQPHLPQITELEVILFLHSCYYRLEATKTTIDTYYTVRTHCPAFFCNRDISNSHIQQMLHTSVCTPLPEPTPEGYRVIICKLLDLDISLYVYSETLRLFTMVTDRWLLEEGTCPGHIVVFDMSDTNFAHYTKLSIVTTKQMLCYMQEALPFRLKSIHFINPVPFMDQVMTFIKPFLNKELSKVLNVHPEIGESLYNFVPKSCLPSDLGGNAESYKVLQEKMIANVTRNNQWYLDDEKYRRVIESRRPGKAKDAAELFGVEGTFKKLDID